MAERNSSLEKALKVLDLYQSQSRLTLTSIAQQTGLSNAAISRILNSLEEMKYIYKDKIDGGYYLTDRVFTLSRNTNIQKQIVNMLDEPVARLCRKCGLAVTVSVRQGLKSYIAIRKNPYQGIAVVVSSEEMMSLNLTAAGKVLTAFSGESDKLIDEIDYVRLTDKSIVDKEEYKMLLEEVKEEKLAYDMGFTAVSGAKQMMQSSRVAAKNLDKFFEGMKDGLKSRGNSKKLSESLGLMMGLQIANNLFPGVEQQIYATDSTKKISTANYLAGVYDALNHKSSMQYKGKPLTRETANEYIQERINAAAEVEMAKQHGADKQKNEAYMATKAKEAGIQKLPEGVLYKEIKKGSGPIAKENQTVEVEYEGRLINDTIFDKSEKPVTFPVNAVVKGWQVVLTHMPAGSEWEVYIPWNVGYGARGAGQNIPPFSTLIFKMKLISVK